MSKHYVPYNFFEKIMFFIFGITSMRTKVCYLYFLCFKVWILTKSPGYIHCRKPQMMCVFYSLFWGSTLFWEGNDNPLQYSFLENPMNGGDLWATQSIESQNWPRLSTSLSFFFSYWYRLVLSLLQHFTVFSE